MRSARLGAVAVGILFATLAVAQDVDALTKKLRSRKPADRAAAANAIAKLGDEKGKDASRALCEAMMDPAIVVRVAAAEALEEVNSPLYAAVLPIIVGDRGQIPQAILDLKTLKKDALPAMPVLMKLAVNGGWSALDGSGVYVGTDLADLLNEIAPDEPAASVLAVAVIGKGMEYHCHSGMKMSRELKSGADRCIVPLLAIAVNSTSSRVVPAMRVDAIETLAAISGKTSRKGDVVKILGSLKQLDQSEEIRQAASEALFYLRRD